MSEYLPVGYKHGCFTIIGGTDVYQSEYIEPKINRMIKNRQELESRYKRSQNVRKSLEYIHLQNNEEFEKYINELRNEQGYKLQCRCGKIQYCDDSENNCWRRKKLRYCGIDCGLKLEREQKLVNSCKRVKDSSYELDLTGKIHESLHILGCIDDSYEILTSLGDKRKYGSGTIKIYKIYKCKCYLCNKEYEFRSDKFSIEKDYYGINAVKGYYSNAHCDCHYISSFQWRTAKILNDNNIRYKVEVQFDGLCGINGGILRYDFAVLDDNNNIKYLIECQGEQHYKPVDSFGGYEAFKIQKINDELKRNYANKHNIQLIEIPFTCNTYEKEFKYLSDKLGILTMNN